MIWYHVVRSTRPTILVSPNFVPLDSFCAPREQGHLNNYPDFPHPKLHLNATQKFYYRHPSLRHLRIEQVVRYFSMATWNKQSSNTDENTMANDDDEIKVDATHRHYDRFAEELVAGSQLQSTVRGIDAYQRRGQGRLGVSRLPYIEPLGQTRDKFYEAKLCLGLPWYLKDSPKRMENDQLEWEFHWDIPHGAAIAGIDPDLQKMVYNRDKPSLSFEELSTRIEDAMCAQPGLVCPCCNKEERLVCKKCVHATSFHRCDHHEGVRWRKGTLYGGKADYARILWHLHQKGLPTELLKQKADEFVAAGDLMLREAEAIIQTIELERGRSTTLVGGGAADSERNGERLSGRLTAEELQAELDKRIQMMKDGVPEGEVSDQSRVFDYCIEQIEKGSSNPLRLTVQASAGTGKSFLLTTLYLYCLTKKIAVKAAAPTGIAASNIDVPGTAVGAETLHFLLAMDGELNTKFDVSRQDDPKIQELNVIQVLMIDEFSMIDTETYSKVVAIFRELRRGDAEKMTADGWGRMHVIFFGDLKQLPPATTHAPFIRLPEVRAAFDFRTLNQNRRVVQDAARQAEIQNFHEVLMDVAVGRNTERVRKFFVEAYLRGAEAGPPARHELEGSTSIWTKRRFRDRYNRTMVKKIAKVANHSLKIRGRVRARGAQGKNWFNKFRESWCRSKARTNALWTLHLAGDFAEKHETERPRAKPHYMRCMLTSNLDVKARFANGYPSLSWKPSRQHTQSPQQPHVLHPRIARGIRYTGSPSLLAPSQDPGEGQDLASLLARSLRQVLQGGGAQEARADGGCGLYRCHSSS